MEDNPYQSPEVAEVPAPPRTSIRLLAIHGVFIVGCLLALAGQVMEFVPAALIAYYALAGAMSLVGWLSPQPRVRLSAMVLVLVSVVMIGYGFLEHHQERKFRFTRHRNPVQRTK